MAAESDVQCCCVTDEVNVNMVYSKMQYMVIRDPWMPNQVVKKVVCIGISEHKNIEVVVVNMTMI